MTVRSLARTVIGATLLWGSVGAAGFTVAWTIKSRAAAAVLHGSTASSAFDPSSSCHSTTPPVGHLAGWLEIPSLHVTAAVEQGESDSVLAAAVGHDTHSVWPGYDGTSVLAAHDVTYFSHLASLRPGTIIRYVGACEVVTFRTDGHKVVPAGSPVYDSTGPTLVLDTCWPTDALFWTPDRLLVTATELSVSRRSATDRPSTPKFQPLAVPAPAALVAQGLTIETNPTVLGTLSIGGKPAAGFVESPGPLSMSATAITAYLGALHSLASDRPDWWAAIAPGVAFPTDLAGAEVSEYISPLDIEVSADGLRPTGAVLTADVDMGGAGTGQLTVTCRVEGSDLVIASWKLT